MSWQVKESESTKTFQDRGLVLEQLMLSWDRDKGRRGSGNDQPAKLYISLESSYRDVVAAGMATQSLVTG
jgi:hypothetical protein